MQTNEIGPLLQGVTTTHKGLVLGILYNGVHNKHIVEEFLKSNFGYY